MYRTNAQSRALEEAFIRATIPYQLVGGTRFYERREVKDVLAYLRLVHNPYDVVSFTRVVNVPGRGIGAKTISELERWAAAARRAALHRAAGARAAGVARPPRRRSGERRATSDRHAPGEDARRAPRACSTS